MGGRPPEEVPDRMAGLCAWIAEREDRLVTFPPPVIAGVAHYALTDIHPFADGNGRVARLLSAAILMRLGFISRRLFSFERYYAENRDAYYAGPTRSIAGARFVSRDHPRIVERIAAERELERKRQSRSLTGGCTRASLRHNRR